MRRHREIEVTHSELLFRGVVFDLVRETLRLPSGVEQDLVLVQHHGAVAIAALRDDGRLVLVRQYRHAIGEWMIELPAGRVESGESRLEAARRELEEETGLRAGRWNDLLRFTPAPGFCSERITIFEAGDLHSVPGGGRPADADEEIEVLALTPQEVLKSGAVHDAKTLLAAHHLLH